MRMKIKAVIARKSMTLGDRSLHLSFDEKRLDYRLKNLAVVAGTTSHRSRPIIVIILVIKSLVNGRYVMPV